MYQLNKVAFGEFEQFRFFNAENDNSFSIVPTYGANVFEIILSGQTILEGCSPEELKLNPWGKSVILVPFPNRLKNGTYQWLAKEYHFPINDSITGNALHGFGMQKKMEVLDTYTNAKEAGIICGYEEGKAIESYPFAHRFEVSFKISEGNFESTMTFHNLHSHVIPVGLGWHPYFKIAEKVEEVKIMLPDCDLVGIDEFMIPTGKRYPYDEFQELKRIGSAVLDNCFAVKTSGEQAKVVLASENGTLNYWQETGKGKFPFVQVFTPPARKSIAIEPMTCNIDAFNNGDGLIELAPNEKISATFGFSWTPA